MRILQKSQVRPLLELLRPELGEPDYGLLIKLLSMLDPRTHDIDLLQAQRELFPDSSGTQREELTRLSDRLYDRSRAIETDLSLQVLGQESPEPRLSFLGLPRRRAHAETRDLAGAVNALGGSALIEQWAESPSEGRVLIVTCNPNETRAVRHVFGQPAAPQAATATYALLPNAGNYNIFHLISEQGPTSAALAVSRAIEALRPSIVVALGMAFGCRPDQHRLGDVVVARHVVDYDPERVGQTRTVPRGARMAANGEWLARVSQAQAFHGESPLWPNVHFGLMLSGSKLVDNEELRNALVEKTGGEAIAGDMEAAAIAHACSAAPCHWLVIKGIADWANAKPAGDDKRSIQYEASHCAARVLRATLAADEPIAAPIAPARKNGRRLPSPITPDYDSHSHELAENQAQRVSLKVFGGDSDTSGPAVVGRNAFEYLMEWALSPFDDAYAKEPNVLRTVAPERRYFALLGEYGMGKTVLCQRLTKALEARHEEGKPAPVPLYFDLRRLTNLKAQKTGSDGKVYSVDRVPTIEEVVEECIARGWRNAIDEPKHTLTDVRGWLDEGALVIFDGLDEVLVHFTDTNGQQFVNQLLRLLPEKKKKTGTPSAPGKPPVFEAPSSPVLMLVTCRTHFFRSVRDQYAMLTERGRGDLDDTQFETLVLLPFAEEQIVEYLQKAIPGVDVDHLLTTLRSVHNLGEVATRPYLLSLISQHLEQIERWRAEGRPVYGVTLYREFVSSWLTRDNSKHQLKPVDKIALAKTLAVELWLRGQRLIGIDRLNAWFAEWRESRVGPGQDYLKKIDIEKLEEDLRNSNFLVREDARSSRGVDESASGFRFAHTSLQEYFLAEYLFDAVRDAAPERWGLPTPSVETLNFLGQLLNESSDCARWIETISQWRTVYRPSTSETLLQFACVALDRGWTPPVLAGIDLAGANLSGFTLRARDGTPLNLAGATFRGADLRDARLVNCRFDRAVFADALLDRAEFDHCSLRSTDFSDARLLGTRLRHVDVRGARWAGAVCRAVDCVASRVDDAVEIRSAEMFVAPARGPIPARDVACLSHVSTQPGPLPAYGLAGDGRLLSMSLGKIQLTDMERLAVAAEAISSQDELTAYAFSPDGALLATASRTGSLCVWDAQTLQLTSSLAGHGGETLACGFSPDNRQLVAFEWPGAIQIRDVETLAAVTALTVPRIDCRACRYSREGREIELVDGSGSIHYFDAQSLQPTRTLTLDPAQKISACRYSPDASRWLGIDGSHCIWVRDAATFEVIAELQHTGKITSAEFSDDGAHIVSASESGALQLWNIATGQSILAATRTHSPRIVAWLPRTNQLFCAGSGSRFELHDLPAPGAKTIRSEPESAGISSCAFSPDGAFIVCGDDSGAAWVWRHPDLQPVAMLNRHRTQITACAVSASADFVATADASGEFALGSFKTEALTLLTPPHLDRDTVVFCTFSPSGRRLLSVTNRRQALIWDVQTGSFIVRRQSVITGEFVSDDQVFFLDGKLHPGIWDVATGRVSHPSMAHRAVSCRFSAVGGLLLYCPSEQRGSAMNSTPDETPAIMRPDEWLTGNAHSRPPQAMMRDRSLILSGHGDGILRVWNAQTCEEAAVMLCTRTSTAAWSSRENRLLCAYGEAWRRLGWLAPDETNTMRRWPLETFGDECPPLPPQLR